MKNSMLSFFGGVMALPNGAKSKQINISSSVEKKKKKNHLFCTPF